MPASPEPIRIAISIGVTPGVSGGITQSTQGLVSSLGQLEGPEDYLLVADTPGQAEWIRQYCGPRQQVALKPANAIEVRSQSNGNLIKRMLRPTANVARRLVARLAPEPPRPVASKWPELAVSDGYFENLACDVLHFPTQEFVLCALPTIYNPHDLQHLHYPQFFPPMDLAGREVMYRSGCLLANTVVVGSEWIKQDVIRQFGLHPDKLQIIPWASPTQQYPPIEPAKCEQTRQRLGLPGTYALYPAVAWAHKNHLRLLDALAVLRDERGLVVNLVCTGARYEPHWPRIEQRIRDLKLASQVKFAGFLSEADLRAVYRRAQFLVLPSLFEADSCPIHEAWCEGIPVASSNLTGLPDQVGDAGLLFDAKDVSAIADAVQRMSTDAGLRRELIERGHQRLKDFDWTRTAKAYRAVYRRAASATLNEEDRWLLSWDWMREPKRRPDVPKNL